MRRQRRTNKVGSAYAHPTIRFDVRESFTWGTPQDGANTSGPLQTIIPPGRSTGLGQVVGPQGGGPFEECRLDWLWFAINARYLIA